MISTLHCCERRVTKPVICQLLHSVDVGGAEILARQFAEQARDEFDFVFACLDSEGVMAKEVSEAGFPVETLGRRPGFDLNCARQLATVCRRHKVRLVHAHQYAPFFYASLARLGRRRRMPIVFTEHGRDYPDYRRWKRVLANWLLPSRRDRFVAVGESVRQALIDYEGLPANRIEVIYNGSDLEAYDPARSQRAAVREELGLTEDSLVVIQVARLNRLKDHPTAIRAMAQLRVSAPTARLLIVGDGEERSVLERLIVDLGLGDIIRLLGTRRDIPRLLQAADIFLLTSVSEGIPLTLIEAMASGLPCVATRVGGVPEVLIDRQTGLLTEARSPDGIAAALRALAAAPATRERFGQSGRSCATKNFDHRQMHFKYRHLYREMLS